MCQVHFLISRFSDGKNYRLDRVLSFLSRRSNWNSPPPHTQASVSPPWFRGEAHSLAGEGVGVSHFQRGDRHCGTLGIYELCGKKPLARFCQF